MNITFIIILVIILIILIVSNYSVGNILPINNSNPQQNTQTEQIQDNFEILTNNEPYPLPIPSINIIESFVNTQVNNNNNNNDSVEHFAINPNIPKPSQISFKKITPNKLYYGLPCDYIKNDCFYDALEKAGFKMTDDIKSACLIVPCSYETTEKEIEDLQKNKISQNQFGDGVRVFMLNNTDYMVSKLALWKYLKEKYGANIASTMIPYTWDLTDPKDVEIFKTQFDKNKLYITKNNYQRQEGLEIQNNLDSILNSRNKYILVQELLQDPYLVSGRKINLRVYVLVVRDNYSNIKLLIYKDGFMYYTPELFEPNNPSFKKNITTGYIDRQVYVENPLTHMDFRKWLDNPNRTLTPIEKYIVSSYPNIKLSDYIFSQIYEQLGFIFQTYEDIIGTKTFGISFQVYGVDVAINQDLKPMIMEINKGPDLTAKDGRDKDLKMNLSTDILKSVGLLPNTLNNNFITVLEKINIDGDHISIHNIIDH
jgi:hypothetical protein